MMESTYSVSSLEGLVSSKRRLHLPPNSCGESEIEVDGFRVADVQIAVRLGRKARMHAAAVLVGLQVVEDDLADEVGRGRSSARRSRAGSSDFSLLMLCHLAFHELHAARSTAMRLVDALESRSRGPALPAFQTAAERSCGRTRRREWAGTSGLALIFSSSAAARKRCVQARRG